MTTDPRTNPWSPDSYGPITGSGARKLASSRIAPLVALARGYWSVDDAEGAKAFAKMSRSLAGTVTLRNQLVALVSPEDEDLLAMPWFSAQKVADEGTAARSQTFQYRPATPVTNAQGKEAKYMWFANQNMVIDLHPSTPVEWLDSAPQVLVTEGLLKGDSALTAMLLGSNKVTVDDLSKITDENGAPLTTDAARLALQALMVLVPAQLRTVVASSASVTTWQGRDADWRKVNMRGKRVIVAFDGDLADNVMVWKETDKFMREVRSVKGEPVLLSLFSAEVEAAQIAAGMDPSEKLGIDDYFDQIGDWDSLLSLVTADLPPRPKGAEFNAEPGDWRIHPQNDAIAQEFVQSVNADGSKGAGAWVTKARVGGRLVRHVESRRPNESEIIHGVVSTEEKMRLEHSSCEIEISLLDRNQDIDDEPQTFRVYGPATLMSMPPQDWVRHAVQLPNEVLAHPDWPPRKGQDWLSAIKANKRDQVEHAVAWNTMGWVPTPNGHPAFIVGEQVVANSMNDLVQTRRGVDDRVLPGASKFGVIDEWDFAFNREEGAARLAEYKAQVIQDIRDVVRVFITNGFWKNRATAVAVVCAMYRPTIPKHPGTTLYFVGPKGAGKSYTASFIMRGWQQRPGTWTGSSLPGSAGDTFGAHENSVSLAPIWIIDDLAPQSDRRKAEQQQSDLEAIIRAMFNNSAKRRLDGRTMEQRDVANPIAMLAVTAENPPTVPSIQDRTLVFNVPKGAFNDSEDGWREKELVKLSDNTVVGGAPARLTAAMIRFWMHTDTRFGATWRDKQESLSRTWEEEKDRALAVLMEEHGIESGEAQRFVGQIASLGLTLSIMYELALWAGIEEDDPLLDNLTGDNGFMRDLYGLAAQGILRARGTTPGRALLKALNSLLASGRAHLVNPTTPGAPPYSTTVDESADVGGVSAAMLNQKLGWEFDARQQTWVPKGTRIGFFGKKDGEEIALFDMPNSFKLAQREYPELIPHGQSPQQSWASVYAEHLTASAGAARKESGAKRLRLSAAGEHKDDKLSVDRLSGVPVLASELFASTDEDSDTEN